VFLSLLLTIVLRWPNPSPFQYIVCRSVLALAAAGIAAMIPGLLDVRLSTRIRASGAIAVFVVVYFFAPAPIPAGEVVPEIKRWPTPIVHVATLLNGPANYVLGIRTKLHESLETDLHKKGYELHWEEEMGSPDESRQSDNEAAIARLLQRFAGRKPDYVVTIGTAVSQHAKPILFDRNIPQVFVGVTNPIAECLVKSLRGDTSRGNIAGTTYPPRADILMQRLEQYFGGQRIGFIYSRKYPQDVQLKDAIEKLAGESTLEIVFIETAPHPR
jgi:hypothetical protein